MDGGAQVHLARRQVDLLVDLQPLLHDLAELGLRYLHHDGFVDVVQPDSITIVGHGQEFERSLVKAIRRLGQAGAMQIGGVVDPIALQRTLYLGREFAGCAGLRSQAF